jgi:peptidoglycan/LPS O-acetylase OafA/YrhL
MSVSIPIERAEPRARSALARFFALDLLDNRYPALHGMRVLAILSVVQFHVTTIFVFDARFPLDKEWTTTSTSIFFGMDLFFVLSGFLIGSILLRSVDTTGSQHVRRFYLRRVFRTFPSYYLVLTVLALAMPLTDAHRRHLVLEYAYLTNFLPITRTDVVMPWGWSLGLEEQFYLVVPLLFLALQRLRGDRARLTLLGVLWAGGLAVRLALYARGHDWKEGELIMALYYRTYARFDTLVAGIILAIVQARYRAPIARWLESPAARAALALASLACLYLLLQPSLFGDEHALLVRVFAWGTVTSVMYFGAVLLLLNGGDGLAQRALSAPFWRRVATLGYGVYLVHIPMCDHVVTPAARRLLEWRWPMPVVWTLAVAGAFACSLAVAYALHLLVEKPALRLRDAIAG